MKFIIATLFCVFNLYHSLSQSTTEVFLEPPYRVEIYTALFCGHCKAVKTKLEEYGIAYEEYDITLKGKRYSEMLERTGGNTGAPRIFINGHYLGSRKDFDNIKISALQKIAKQQKVTLKIYKQ